MGIYPNHGLEYWIKINENVDYNKLNAVIERLKIETNMDLYITKKNSICILSTSRTDDRLVKSKYFQDRKEDWFHHRTCKEEWCEQIKDQSLVDIEIEESELNVIDKIKNEFCEHIIFAGWFDVNTIGYSYS